MDVGDEALDPVGDELDRPLEELRQRGGRHLVGIGVHLDAERAADVLGDDAHLVLLEPEVLGEQVLHHVRRLRALIDGEPRLARVPIGDDGARLVAHSGVAAEPERRLDHRIGLGEALVWIPGVMRALEREIVAELGMDHRRAGIKRGLGVGDSGQLLVVTSTSSQASSASARERATTAPPPRPASRRAPPRSACCGADLMPLRWVSTPTQGVITLASSAPVTTAITPGAVFAAAATIP